MCFACVSLRVPAKRAEACHIARASQISASSRELRGARRLLKKMGLMAVTIRRRISPETLELSGRNHADCHINIPNSRSVSGARRGGGGSAFLWYHAHAA